MTDKDLKSSPENEPSMGDDPSTLMGVNCEDKGEEQLESSQAPSRNEWAYVLVTPDEINASETLRLQLWDSDKHTA